MMAGIAGILHINSRKSRDFWAPYENIREKKMVHFLRKMKHILQGHGASETPPTVIFLDAYWDLGRRKPQFCPFPARVSHKDSPGTVEAGRRRPRRRNSDRQLGRWCRLVQGSWRPGGGGWALREGRVGCLQHGAGVARAAGC